MQGKLFDVVVVGGGPAGLSAALMLGRCRRKVLVCDTGKPRNRWSAAMHGYLTRDGVAPRDFLDIGRHELAKYGIEWCAGEVASACRAEPGFDIRLTDGSQTTSRFLLIATGVVDELPRVEGLKECFGRSAFHCPYCDAWEWRDRRLGVLGGGTSGARSALGMITWSPDVMLFSNGTSVPRPLRERIERNRIQLVTARIERLAHEDGRLTSVVLRNGDEVPRDALLVTTISHPQALLASSLGCALNSRGTVDATLLSGTNIPGVFVAGDVSRDAQFVVVAAAEGVKAAMAINQELQRQETRP